jgi:site-specific DNA-cytosine methylase
VKPLAAEWKRQVHPPARGDHLNYHPRPLYQTIPVKAVIPRSLGTRSQRINPWIPADEPAATICRNDAGYELLEAAIKPTWQSYRVLTGQEKPKHFGLTRIDPEKPCPTIQKGQPTGTTGGLIHPYEIRHLTISEIKLMTSFPAAFRLEGSFHKKWARVGNSVPPLFMRAAIAKYIRREILPGIGRFQGATNGLQAGGSKPAAAKPK